MGHDVALGLAASQGQFQLNAYQPLIALNLLDSLALLAGAMQSFAAHCVHGLAVNHERLAARLGDALMLATALAPHIGHARTAQVVQHAREHGSTVRGAALALAVAAPQDIDRWLEPQHLLHPTRPS
jgi:fumarate hydratase class II